MKIRNIFILFLVMFLGFQIQCSPPQDPDVTPPTVVILYPYDGSVISGVVTVSIETNDEQGVRNVWYFLDGEKMGTSDNANPKFELDVSELREEEAA